MRGICLDPFAVGIYFFAGRTHYRDHRPEARLASFCRETQDSAETRAFLRVFVCCVLLDVNVCFLTHGRYEGRPIRNFVRCRSLAAERSSGALARAAWLLELSPQSLRARELSGLYVGGAASKLRPVRPAEGAAGCSLRARKACARGAARIG